MNTKVYEPKFITDSVYCLQEFLECDLWNCFNNGEFKNEDDMVKYLRDHFEICLNEIKKLQKKSKG